MRMWCCNKESGQECVGVKLLLPSGVDPSNGKTLEISAAGLVLSITADWPAELISPALAYWKKHYENKKEKESMPEDVRRMCIAEQDTIKSIIKYEDDKARATVDINLPFEVKPTRNPDFLKSFKIKSTGTTLLCFSLDSAAESTFAKKQVIELEEFD